MVPGADPAADRRRLLIYVGLIVAATGTFAVIGWVTQKPALVAAAIATLALLVGKVLLDSYRERRRQRDD